MERGTPQKNTKGAANLSLFGREKNEEEILAIDQADSLLLSSTDREDPQKPSLSRTRSRAERYQTTRSDGKTFLEKKLDDAVGMIEQLQTQMAMFDRLNRQQTHAKRELQNALSEIKQLQQENTQLKSRLAESLVTLRSAEVENTERLRKELDLTRQVTERSQGGLMGELEQYHKVLQQTTKNLSQVLEEEIHELKETMVGQEQRISELTKENADLREKAPSKCSHNCRQEVINLELRLQQLTSTSEERIALLIKEKDTLQNELTLKDMEVSRLMSELKRASDKSPVQTHRSDELLDQANIEIELLREELRSTTLELNKCKSSLADLDEQNLQLKADVVSMNSRSRTTASSTRTENFDYYCQETLHDYAYLREARRKLADLRDRQLTRLGGLVQSLRHQ